MFQLKVNQWCFYEYSFHWPTCKTTLRGTEVKKGYGLQRLCTMNQSETSSAVGASMSGKCLWLKKRKEIKYASFLVYFLSKIQVNCFAVILLFKISKQTLDDMCYKKEMLFFSYIPCLYNKTTEISVRVVSVWAAGLEKPQTILIVVKLRLYWYINLLAIMTLLHYFIGLWCHLVMLHPLF